MQVEIKRINIGSAFKIGAIVTALTFLIIGIPIFALQGAVLGSMMAVSNSSQFGGSSSLDPFGAGMGIAGMCMMVGILTVVYAIFGGIGAAVWAFVYNLTVGWVGGLKIELEREDGKFKNEM